MVNEISRREVLNNLIRFKENLLEMGGKENKQGKRVYRVLINRHTGDMRFTQRINTLERYIAQKGGRKESAQDWKEIHIIVQQDTPRETASFELLDERDRAISPSDIDPLAWRIAKETLDILNARAKEVKGTHGEMLPEEVVLSDLSMIHLKPQRERIEDLPGWKGSISRLEAEKILKEKPAGTFLLREGDEITISISFHFAEANRLSIHPYLLTVVEEENHVADILLLETDKGWIIYHDDPNLRDSTLYHYYPSPQSLLHTLPMARHPL